MPAVSASRTAVLWALLAAMHLALVFYAIPVQTVFGDGPFGGPDYQTHYQHTHTLQNVMAEFGHAWAYDPDLLAGHPTGLIFDVDNKLHFGFTMLLRGLGVPLHVAFNLFTLLSSLLAPLSLWLAARLLGHTRSAQMMAFALGTLAWHFDPTTRFCWGGGMVSFATAAHVCAVVVAVMHRLMREGRTAYGVALVVLLPLVLRTHAWSFVVLVVPLTGLYVAGWRRVAWRTHVFVWAAAALGLLANLDWLAPALAHRELIVPTARLGQATPAYLVYDFLELMVDPLNTGFVVQRTFLRALVVAGAGLALWGWRRERDERAWVGLLTLGWLLGLTYFGSLVPGVKATEPYRFAVPLTLWAVVIASPWLCAAWARLRGLPQAARGVVAVLAVMLTVRMYQQVAPFLPMLTPGPAPSGHAANLLPAARMQGVSEETRAVAAWLAEQPRSGRVLVQTHALGEYLRWATDWPVLGGFPDRRMIFSDANLFYFRTDDHRYGEGLAAYLERYNVAYVVMTYPYMTEVERRLDVLASAGIVAGTHRVYRVKKPSGYFLNGSGEVEASLNRIAVKNARPGRGGQSVTLRYHWMAELTCSPNCRVERAEVVDDSAGFIKIVGDPLPAEFAVTLDYAAGASG